MLNPQSSHVSASGSLSTQGPRLIRAGFVAVSISQSISIHPPSTKSPIDRSCVSHNHCKFAAQIPKSRQNSTLCTRIDGSSYKFCNCNAVHFQYLRAAPDTSLDNVHREQHNCCPPDPARFAHSGPWSSCPKPVPGSRTDAKFFHFGCSPQDCEKRTLGARSADWECVR